MYVHEQIPPLIDTMSAAEPGPAASAGAELHDQVTKGI